MTSAPFSTEKRHAAVSTFGWSLRKGAPVAAVTAALMLLSQPMVILLGGLATKFKHARLMSLSADPDISIVYTGTQVFILMISALLTVVVASMMLGYLQSKRSLDLFHSLPVTRRGLFFSKYLAGLTLISAPLVLLFLLNCAAALGFGLHLGLTADGVKIDGVLLIFELGRDLLAALLLQTAAYTLTCFVFINTGTVFDSVISMIAVNVVYPVLMLIVTLFLNQRLYGFSEMLDAETYMLLSPFARLMATSELELPLWTLIWWLLFTPALLVLSAWQYKRRRSEHTGNAYTFPLLKVLFKITIPFASGIALGIAFTAIFGSELVLAASFLMGAVVAYLIVEAVVSRGFKNIIRGGIPLLVAAAMFAGLYVFTMFGGLGYETRVPAREQIKSVTVIDLPMSEADFSTHLVSDGITLTEAKSIDAFYNLHKKLANAVREQRAVQGVGPATALVTPKNFKRGIANQLFLSDEPVETVSYRITLKSGVSLKRSYEVSSGDFPDLFREAAALRELRLKAHPLLNPGTSASGWNHLTLSPALGIQPLSTDISLSKEQSKELVRALRKDLEAETPAQLEMGYPPLGFFSATQDSKDYNWFYAEDIPVKPHYLNLKALFEKYGWTAHFQNTFPSGMTACVVKDVQAFLNAHGAYFTRGAGSLDLFAGKDYGFETALTADPALIAAFIQEARFPDTYPADGMFVMLAHKTAEYTETTRVYYIPKDKIPAEALALNYRKLAFGDLPLSPADQYGYPDEKPPVSAPESDSPVTAEYVSGTRR